MIQIRPDPVFLAALQAINKSNPALGKRIQGAVERFQIAPQSPGLNFEKLRGSDCHSIRVTRGVRIILRQDGPDAFVLVNVGSHDIYRRYE